jgi:hypothetical protein
MKSNPYLFAEKEVPVKLGMSVIDASRAFPWRSVNHTYDVSCTRRWRNAQRPSGYLVVIGSFVGLDPAGIVWPLRPGLMFVGIIQANEITTCRILTHARVVLTVLNVKPMDRGRPVFCGAPEGPVSLDPAVGERVGYIIYVEGENRALVQVLPAEDEFVDLSISPSFYPVETSDSRAMQAARPFNSPRVRKTSAKK